MFEGLSLPESTLVPTRRHLEKHLEKYLSDKVRKAGGETRKVKFIGHAGAPDRVVMHPGRDRYGDRIGIIWVEIKNPNGKGRVEVNQAREHERLRQLGQKVVVIDSFEGVDELVATWI